MKYTAVLLSLGLLLLFTTGCKKSKASKEPTLTVVTTPAANSTNLNLLGPNFPLTVEITSVMPAKGVKIDITANIDGSTATPYFSSSNTTAAPQNNYTITNTPTGQTCVVNITVTSQSDLSNVWKGQYRYSGK
jgi:hypothetical protein